MKNQLDYIAHQLSRSEKKKFEHYVVTRIWHLLNDLEIKFTTQQYVKRPAGIALTDMFFPQLAMHIEIDEGHHFDSNGALVINDKIREADIINATGHKLLRIKVSNCSIENLHAQIDVAVNAIRETRDACIAFEPWNFTAEHQPETYIQKGYIDIINDVAFTTTTAAASCFGRTYKPHSIWNGGVKHPIEKGKIIWFPKLYDNGSWDNKITDDDTVITEICKDESKLISHVNSVRKTAEKRIVFARVRSPLGDTMYRFKGEYEVDLNETSYIRGAVYKRIATRVSTYAPLTKIVSR